MAAISSGHATTTTLTPPSSRHASDGYDHGASWDYAAGQHEDPAHDASDPANRHPLASHNGNATPSSYHANGQMAAYKTNSADSYAASQWDKKNDTGALPPPAEPNMSRSAQSGERSPRPDNPDGENMRLTEDSKWIHRDKLAKIESEELQAAGIYVPRSRAPSKQRRDRSQSRLRRGAADPAEQGSTRSRKDSSVADFRPPELSTSPSWDLRTPEEIAEEEANAYFASNTSRSGSRIPVAKTSPAPISLDHIERGSTGSRKLTESPDGDGILYGKPRSRSTSLSAGAELASPTSLGPVAKRGTAETSPKKSTPTGRKSSAPSKPSTATGRPGTRSGSGGGTRPSTRSGDKQPEGDPPWLINSYKPDPRLPPDQQILPTVARRMQQEKWEKEGTYGDIYDRDFRPLNDKALPQRPVSQLEQAEDEPKLENDEWPLKPEAARSPNQRQGSYSTMPKISDKPPLSPLSPRPPQTPQTPAHPPHPPQEPKPQPERAKTPERLQEMREEQAPKRGGACGCCVVM